LNEKELPKEARDHSLSGNWNDYRELHVSGDLLLVYKIEMGTLYLARIGTHSQLFN
jgi:mRNA interferase YafQ